MNVIYEKITIFHAIKVIHCIFNSFLIPLVLYNYILYPNKFTKVIDKFYYLERMLIMYFDTNNRVNFGNDKFYLIPNHSEKEYTIRKSKKYNKN